MKKTEPEENPSKSYELSQIIKHFEEAAASKDQVKMVRDEKIEE